MFEFIRGKLIEANPAYVVLETGGVGFAVFVSLNTYSRIATQQEVLLYVHQIVREDAHLLYGFHSKEERTLFRLLISVSGIGANTANVMLSSMTVDEIIAAILTENVNAIKSIKGIGPKTAQRVIIELKDKVGKESADLSNLTLTTSSVKEEAAAALVMLGFARAQVAKTLDKILAAEKVDTVEELIKRALKQL